MSTAISESVARERFLSSLDSLKQDPDTYSLALKRLSQSKFDLPIGVFKLGMSPLSAVVKFLHENRKIPLSRIADHLNRSYRAVWGAYEKVKDGSEISISVRSKFIPEFPSNFSILEATVKFLKEEYLLSLSSIAHELGRDPRTIWTIYRRACAKGDVA